MLAIISTGLSIDPWGGPSVELGPGMAVTDHIRNWVVVLPLQPTMGRGIMT